MTNAAPKKQKAPRLIKRGAFYEQDCASSIPHVCSVVRQVLAAAIGDGNRLAKCHCLEGVLSITNHNF